MGSGSRGRLGVAVGLLALAIAGCGAIGSRATPLPVYMAVPDLPLTNQDGQPFSLGQTWGKVLLLAPIFTSCPDVCPVTTGRMREIQARLGTERLVDRVFFASVSIDPQRDSPQVLKQYAGDHGVNTAGWVFLTGTPAAIRQLTDALGIYVERVYTVDGTPVPEGTLTTPLPAGAPYQIDHSNLIFLVDRDGSVRALLPGSETDVNEALSLIRQLAR